jgi:hypothetical protein
MTLQVHRDGDPDVVDAVLSCDVELADDCRALEELGEQQGWSDEQFHDLVTGPEYGWTFDPRSRRYLCPPCAEADERRRRRRRSPRKASPPRSGHPRRRPGRLPELLTGDVVAAAAATSDTRSPWRGLVWAQVAHRLDDVATVLRGG